ncbi:ABC transporter ATP-binding protein [Martelella alba]|nr:ABC transporter ATP-binding protein [Martelella alba]
MTMQETATPHDSQTGAEPLLDVKGLHVAFDAPAGTARILEDVNLAIHSGEILGVVGESGSGKSVTAMSIIRLLSKPGRVTEGSVIFRNQDLLALNKDQMRHIRGSEIAMIFQNPRSSLNPVFKIGRTMREVLKVHEGLKPKEADRRAMELLSSVGLGDPASILKRYPHQVSGGMAQRIMIALALASRPHLLIADEPTTALDVTIQYQIIRLLKQLRDETGLAQIVITHNLGVVAELCDRVAVMYAGSVVEEAPVVDLFDAPRHPYTKGLLAARAAHASGERRLQTIPGQVPDLLNRPSGCAFRTRCPFAADICATARPPVEDDGSRKIACHRWKEIA